MTYRPPIRFKMSNIDTALGKCAHDTSPVASVPRQISIEPGLSMTGLSIVNGRFRITAGASYYIEASTSFIGLNRPSNGVFEAALYNTTTATEIGQRLVCNLPTGTPARTDLSPRATRWCARALILAGDFGANSTMDIEFRVVACSPTGSTWYSSYEQTSPSEGTSHVSVWRVS